MARPFLSVIIPAWNEAERLPLTLIDVDRQLAASDYSYEVIIVNDGSDDRTSFISNRFASIMKDCKVIDSPEHRGKGAAIRIGALTAKGNWRLIMDADNSFSIAEFNRILPFLQAERGVHVAIGSRAEKETLIDPPLPFLRRAAEFLLNILTRRVFRSRVRDFLLGFQCFSAEAADKIFSLTRLDSFSTSQEAILLAERLGYRISEVSVIGSYARGSHFRFRGYLQWILDTIRIWWWLKRDRYHFPH